MTSAQLFPRVSCTLTPQGPPVPAPPARAAQQLTPVSVRRDLPGRGCRPGRRGGEEQPKKGTSLPGQAALNGGFPGQSPRLGPVGSLIPPRKLRQLTLQMRRQVPRHTHTIDRVHRGTSSLEEQPRSWSPSLSGPSRGWGHPVHAVGVKDERPATEEVPPKHLLLLFCLFGFSWPSGAEDCNNHSQFKGCHLSLSLFNVLFILFFSNLFLLVGG